MHQEKILRSVKMREFQKVIAHESSIVTPFQLCGDDCDSTPQISSGLRFNPSIIDITSLLQPKNDIYKYNKYSNTPFLPLDLSSNGIKLLSYVSTLSAGKIRIISGNLIEIRKELNPNIKLNSTNDQLIVSNTVNDFLYPLPASGFKFEIRIRQDSYQDQGIAFYPSADASVILEYKPNIPVTEIKGYCRSLEGANINQTILDHSYRLMNVRNATFKYVSTEEADFTGSDLTNARFIGGWRCLNLTGAILTGTYFEGGTQKYCNVSTPVDSYITFTKDRTETCITPLQENESILINSFVSLENPDFYYTKDVGYFEPIDLYEAIVNRRYLFTNSKGVITITSGEMISFSFETGGFGKLPNDFTDEKFKDSIKLDDNKKNLIIAKPLNNYVMFDFKFKITIKQEATDEFREGTTSVILEYTKNSQNTFPKPRCTVNGYDGNCINYIDSQ